MTFSNLKQSQDSQEKNDKKDSDKHGTGGGQVQPPLGGSAAEGDIQANINQFKKNNSDSNMVNNNIESNSDSNSNIVSSEVNLINPLSNNNNNQKKMKSRNVASADLTPGMSRRLKVTLKIQDLIKN